MNKNKIFSVKNMAKISILSVIAFLLMQLEFPLPMFPGFLKVDLSDLPAVIGGLAMGPVVGILIELFKNLMHLMQTSTAGVGELANFLVGIGLVIPASLIYKKNKNKKNALMGLLIGTFGMAIVGALVNYYIVLPFYSTAMNFPIEVIIGMGSAVNKNIVDLKTFIMFAIVPFNLIKGVIISILTIVMYKRISRIL